MPAAETRRVDEGSPGAGATLGDVLYANSRQRLIPEAEWVAMIHSIAAGDQLALHQLYGRTRRLVFTLAVRITQNRESAEEVTLDVFHDVWRRARTYDPANGSVVGWIMNQARSRAIDRLRHDGRQKRVYPNPDEPTPEMNTDDPREAGALRATGHPARCVARADARRTTGDRSNLFLWINTRRNRGAAQ
jgi:RNA polymerase sigma factor (sigma-70 family)